MRIIDVLHSPWAIKPDRLMEISEIYSRHLRGEKISKDTILLIEAQIGKPLQNKKQAYDVIDGIAVLPLSGVISKRMNLFTQISGGTSSELFARDFTEALNDHGITGIILNVDSPGGTVDGTQELARTIYEARGKKPCMVFCNGMMASAAYWIGSAADAIYISGDTVDVGSIGVVTTHTDYSKAEDAIGIKTTEITAGQYKRIASEHAPLTESGRAYIQSQLDHIYGVFLSDVGRNRGGKSADQVHAQMADGRIFIGQKAIDAGLADGMMSLQDMIGMMSKGEMPTSKTKKAQPGAAAGVVAAQTAAVPTAESEAVQEEIMDVKELMEKHPDLHKAVFEEGSKAGLEAGMKAGADAELARVKSVKAVAMPGHEALIEGFMFDGKTTGEQAAVAIVKAENGKRQAKAEAIQKDGEELHVPAAPVEGAAPATKPSKTRKEFEALDHDSRSAFLKSGGTIKE